MSSHKMLKKTLVIICLTMTAMLLHDGTVLGADSAGEKPAARKKTRDTVIALYQEYHGVNRFFEGFRTVCPNTGFIRINIRKPQNVEISKDENNLFFVVGDAALKTARRHNMKRTREKLDPFPIVYTGVDSPPEKCSFYYGCAKGKRHGNASAYHIEGVSR